ncbi:hypothetical protein FMM80_13995 [Schaedlerella arabinosiphila]|uniref:Integrase n=1 Tax=Schaedlerella arabinosiphila TaxID=2044587 RepID=A0A9X5H809_9FIRM|nr:hypothetical protein [Schaedlerella arabinosiphila]NDO69731.1 hypothetical protein [Schaedlerella arabinosiphila]
MESLKKKTCFFLPEQEPVFRRLDNNGLDMYDEIPVLSTYMGHENLYGTEHYLHMPTENSRDILDKVEEFNKGLFPEVLE